MCIMLPDLLRKRDLLERVPESFVWCQKVWCGAQKFDWGTTDEFRSARPNPLNPEYQCEKKRRERWQGHEAIKSGR